MTWKNLFDMGPCIVTASQNDRGTITQLFSGAMAKGDTQTGTLPSTTTAWTLTVDAAGLVSFSFDDGTYLGGINIEVDVVPQYAHDFSARMTSAETLVGGGQNSPAAYAMAAINAGATTVGADFVDWGQGSDSGNPMPPPATIDLSSLTGARDLVGLYVSGPTPV